MGKVKAPSRIKIGRLHAQCCQMQEAMGRADPHSGTAMVKARPSNTQKKKAPALLNLVSKL